MFSLRLISRLGVFSPRRFVRVSQPNLVRSNIGSTEVPIGLRVIGTLFLPGEWPSLSNSSYVVCMADRYLGYSNLV